MFDLKNANTQLKKEIIELLVFNRGTYTCSEMSHHFDVSWQLIFEIMKAYESFGVVRTTSGYGYVLPAYSHWAITMNTYGKTKPKSYYFPNEVDSKTVIHKRRGDINKMKKNWIERKTQK